MVNSVISVMFMISLAACDDIFEKDITEEHVNQLAPCGGCTLKTMEIILWWESLESADKYQLQVVSPNFEQINTVVLDTLLGNDKWYGNLQPGNYQWRVRGRNNNYKTEYSTMSFSIDTIVVSEAIGMIDNQEMTLSN